jgi:hypothetical protein
VFGGDFVCPLVIYNTNTDGLLHYTKTRYYTMFLIRRIEDVACDSSKIIQCVCVCECVCLR